MTRALIPFEGPCGGLNCGIDFKGGTVLELSTAPKAVDLGKVRTALERIELGDVQVQVFGSPSEAMVRFQAPAGANPAKTVDKVKATVRQALGQVKFERTDVVGPKVSGELFQAGLLALVLSIGLMLIYIWFRFELQFGIGAVVALFHDVFLTFGMIAFTGLEFSLTTVAAILTVIGYSMNDTVVVFDRLRENLRKFKAMPLEQLVDLSINETMNRSLGTSMTLLLSALPLALFGGDTLSGFAWVMVVGIVISAGSSVFIAAPIVLFTGRNRLRMPDAAPPGKAEGAAAR